MEMPECCRRGHARLAVHDELRAERRQSVCHCLGHQAMLALLLDRLEQLTGDLLISGAIRDRRAVPASGSLNTFRPRRRTTSSGEAPTRCEPPGSATR